MSEYVCVSVCVSVHMWEGVCGCGCVCVLRQYSQLQAVRALAY